MSVQGGVRKANPHDFDAILHVINDAAMAYKGIIPSDSWNEPYMSREELETEIQEAKIEFYVVDIEETVVSVMGTQIRLMDETSIEPSAMLIRHAYTLTAWQRKGFGQRLLQELLFKASLPTLIGTWKATEWAIGFYEKVCHASKVF